MSALADIGASSSSNHPNYVHPYPIFTDANLPPSPLLLPLYTLEHTPPLSSPTMMMMKWWWYLFLDVSDVIL